MKRPPLIYVSGPLTCGQVTRNANAALMVGKRLMGLGYAVIVPHVSLLTGILYPEMTHEDWLAYDLRLIRCCDAVFRMVGESPGADEEVVFAKTQGIPVFWTVSMLLDTLPVE